MLIVRVKGMRLKIMAILFTMFVAILAPSFVAFVPHAKANPQDYTAFFYTLSEVYIFGYYDGTAIEVKDNVGTTIWSGTLNEGGHQHLDPGEGIYSVTGTKPYGILVGAPKTDLVVGYYSVDSAGKGTSKKLYTYICPPYYSGSKFIIFAYTNGTDVTVTNIDTSVVLWSGTLDAGEHFEKDLGTESSPTINWTDIFVKIASSQPVSALIYTDQGYHVPSSTGDFVGTLFYTYANYIGNWDNDLNVIAYYNETAVTIKKTETGDTIWSGTLNEGEVHSESFQAPTYITVQSNKDVVASIDPYVVWTWDYNALTFATDKSGKRVGKLFYTTARSSGYLYIFAYENDTSVAVTDQLTGTPVWSGTLNKMEYHEITTSHTVYKVASSNSVSILEGYGSWGAEFAPLSYTVFLPRYDLTVNVVDATSGLPISGASVTADGPESAAGVTDGGKVAFLDLLTGDYIVSASKTGYNPASTAVSLESDMEITLRLTSIGPTPVGGFEVPTNAFLLISPWIVLGFALVGAAVVANLKRKR
jgi:hypothetical protein